ncbi:hypothetical protein E5288_WYG009349 [Bos mutus]|uniref:C2H2-type domain-containing protein n=1 Tax=Bos mutus TaxID=72004 RepID=A0A6B0S2C9_9CETA|nr:hypothetical protein [Bos mutus]
MERSREAEAELRGGRSPSRASRSPEADGDRALSHSCCICGKTFPFQSSLSQHMRKHTGEKPYKCPYCDHRAAQKGNLKIHIRGHRAGTLTQGREPEAAETRVSEGLGGCTSPTKSTSACNRILNGATQADTGKILLRSTRKEAEGVAAGQCAFCKSRFERKKDLAQHVQQAHKPFTCRLCSYATLREEALLSHVEKDHIAAQGPRGDAFAENGKPELPPGEFPCEVCGQAFSQTWFLKAHMKKHRGSFDHGCHICGRRFKEPWFLKNHMKAHGPKAGSKNRPRSELEPVATINDVVQEEDCRWIQVGPDAGDEKEAVTNTWEFGHLLCRQKSFSESSEILICADKSAEPRRGGLERGGLGPFSSAVLIRPGSLKTQRVAQQTQDRVVLERYRAIRSGSCTVRCGNKACAFTKGSEAELRLWLYCWCRLRAWKPGDSLFAVAPPPSGLARAKPHRCCFPEDVSLTVLSNGDQSHTLGNSPSGRAAGEPGAGIAACVSILESSSRDAPRRPEPPRCSVDLKTPACGPQQEGPGPRDAADLPPRPAQAAGLQPPSESQAAYPRERPPDLHTKEHPTAGKRAPAPDLVPLDLSERSSRDDPGRREPASSLQAALAVHPCPYCGHKTYYPEVLWMHKRVWHRVSGQAVAPQWTQPNGYKSIRSNLVFLARSGRTGPPPALGGKECQPLPIARFTRTQVPGGAPGPKGSPSPLGVPTKAAGLPRSKEGHPGAPCTLWTAGPDGTRQTRPGPSPEQPPPKPKQEASPRPGATGGSGGFSRSATPAPTVITRAGPQAPASGRQGAGLGPPNKHSAPDPPKAKFSPQPQGQPHGKGDGATPLPPREPPSKAGSRGPAVPQGPPAPHPVKQEPASEGPEKRLDLLSIFKTYIPKDLASLYQSWGASSPVLERRGLRYRKSVLSALGTLSGDDVSAESTGLAMSPEPRQSAPRSELSREARDSGSPAHPRGPGGLGQTGTFMDKVAPGVTWVDMRSVVDQPSRCMSGTVQGFRKSIAIVAKRSPLFISSAMGDLAV